jgi:hypothetical protein
MESPVVETPPIESWFERNPKKTLLVASFLGILCALTLGEAFLRLWVNYDPGYYTAIRTSGRTLHYPYGDIYINSLGYPDAEFLPNKTKPRIGYFGDSVCFGVGAGYGYRVSELLEEQLPYAEHMNLAQIGHGLSEGHIRQFLRLAEDFRLDKAILFVNLNDIRREVSEEDAGTHATGLSGKVMGPIERMRRRLDWLRGKSYLYTHLRNSVKDFVFRRGYNTHGGQVQYELYPETYRDVIVSTADRINKFARDFRSRGVDVFVVILPYEMQISAEAEAAYSKLGISWEPSFIDRGPQQILISEFEDNFAYLDAYYAFVSAGESGPNREDNRLGEYFVYNRGGRLDWNHPNRNGHKRIAEYILSGHALGPDPGSTGEGGSSPP